MLWGCVLGVPSQNISGAGCGHGEGSDTRWSCSSSICCHPLSTSGRKRTIPVLTAGKPRHGPTSDPLSDNRHHRCPHSSPAPSRSQAAFMERNCVSDAADGARSSPEPEFCLAEPRTVTRHEVALCDRARDSHPGAFIPHPGAGDVRAPLPA